jgi:hypothetical protein
MIGIHISKFTVDRSSLETEVSAHDAKPSRTKMSVRVREASPPGEGGLCNVSPDFNRGRCRSENRSH